MEAVGHMAGGSGSSVLSPSLPCLCKMSSAIVQPILPRLVVSVERLGFSCLSALWPFFSSSL